MLLIDSQKAHRFSRPSTSPKPLTSLYFGTIDGYSSPLGQSYIKEMWHPDVCSVLVLDYELM